MWGLIFLLSPLPPPPTHLECILNSKCLASIDDIILSETSELSPLHKKVDGHCRLCTEDFII